MPDVAPDTHRTGPIFVVGAMGSGTTLLRLMLDSHERIAIPPETGFMRAERATKRIPFWYYGAHWYRRLGWSEAEFNEHLRLFYDELFSRYASQQGKVRWGEKTPWHVWHIGEMARVFPDGVFVAIVRHPGGNTGSNLNRFNHSSAAGERQWRRINKEIVRQGRVLGDRLVLGRYEDLVLQPRRFMRELLGWLGEPWSEQVLQHHAVQASRGVPAKVEGRTMSDDPIDAARVSKWMSVLDDEDRRLLQARASQLGAFFGYRLDDAIPARTMSESDTLLITGSQLDRLASTQDVIDFDVPGEVPLFERPYDRRSLRLVPRTDAKPAATGVASRQRGRAGDRADDQHVAAPSRRRASRAGRYLWRRLRRSLVR